IGLHLSKEFIDLHKGTIEVISKYGTEFIITLYKGDAHLSSDEIIYEPDLVDGAIFNFDDDYEENAFNQENVEHDEERYSILLIEDNSDLVQYLKGKLAVEYQVNFSDGTDAIEKALEL